MYPYMVWPSMRVFLTGGAGGTGSAGGAGGGSCRAALPPFRRTTPVPPAPALPALPPDLGNAAAAGPRHICLFSASQAEGGSGENWRGERGWPAPASPAPPRPRPVNPSPFPRSSRRADRRRRAGAAPLPQIGCGRRDAALSPAYAPRYGDPAADIRDFFCTDTILRAKSPRGPSGHVFMAASQHAIASACLPSAASIVDLVT